MTTASGSSERGLGMRVVIVGSVALDTIRTPAAVHADLLGGSASYASLAARLFARPSLVAVVGEDFPERDWALLSGRGLDLGGLERARGTTFRWEGAYDAQMKERVTLRTEVGVFADFRPRLPQPARAAEALLLGNIDPGLQQGVLEQMPGVALAAVDTMNYWIARARAPLVAVLPRVHVLLLNDEEVRELTGEDDLVQATKRALALGPEAVVVKRGPHGVTAAGPWGWLALPALPLEKVADPTGAGDAFAGGLIGYLAGRDWRRREVFATGLAAGTATASLAVESFGVAGLAAADTAAVRERCRLLGELCAFAPPEWS